MPYDEGLAERVRESFQRRAVRFEEKRMMGGLCFMVNERMCVGVTNDRLMVRLDPEIEAQALKRKGCVPMDFTGRPMRGFVFVEAEGHSADADFDAWLDLALQFNPRAHSSKKRRASETH
jgi:TfoX/Sxy family transcriptional regulator of competence genes